ncbi:MAG: general secretion pathway protein GspB [Gammaproteobacteria bacterium]
MSYILEALKKADQDRVIGAVPDLESTHEVVQPKGRSYGWLWIVAPLLIVNGGLLAVLLTQQDTDATDSTGVPLEQQAGVTMDRPLQPLARTPGPRITEAPQPARSRQPARSAQPASVKPLVPARQPVVAAKPVAPAPPAPVTRKPAPPREQAVAPAVTATAGADTPQVPNWDELSLETRSRITLPRLDVHVYSEDPQRRFILVDLDKYREGETLASGLVLEEILPNGTILSYEGQRFQLDK